MKVKQAITNTSAKIIFVAGKMIPPSETRFVELPKQAASSQVVTMSFDAKGELATTVAKLKEKLESFTQDQLQQLQAEEEQGQKRASAIDAITDEIKSREYSVELEEFALALSSVEDLDALLLDVAKDEAKVAMVNDEIAKRAEQQKHVNQ
ncbi:MAG: hypothetical protein CMO73_12660 [Verrucomicrobiales bacterium]|nr:hypothetical protein [Verrucomicrobiales bacterium]|tara:strand:+ start:9225 stop:9677 length:453 start_codon:yes stop_codon:yes gene_type:complete